MKDCGDYWAYICTYVDDLIVMHKDPMSIVKFLEERYTLKGVGTPEYHLGGDIEWRTEPERVLTWGSRTYVKRCLESYEKLFGAPPTKEVHAPLDPSDHPELDESPLLEQDGIQRYQSLMGMLQWAVTLGRMDIMCAVMTMSRFRAMPREGHLERLKRIFAYL